MNYFTYILEKTEFHQNSGSNLLVSPEFRVISSELVSNCSFMQNLIQQIIYISHGSELRGAKKTLKTFPNPKARVDFLCSFPYSEDDPIISKVFSLARNLFREIYELRNVLVHEIWSSSNDHREYILFSSLDEKSRLDMASGRLWHDKNTNPKDIYDATIRFIRNVKLVSLSDLYAAKKDSELCSWILMQLSIILNEQDTNRRDEAREAFLVFKGTSHLFDDAASPSRIVQFSGLKEKLVTEDS